MSLLTMAAGPVTANADALALQRHMKLQDAAERFEGMMLQELLKPMQQGKEGSFGESSGGFGSGDADRDDSLDTFSSFGTEAVANAIAKDGGVGIAKQVMREVGALGGDKYSPGARVDRYNGGPKLQNGSLRKKGEKKS